MPSQKGNNFSLFTELTNKSISPSFSYLSLSISLLVLLEYTASNRQGITGGGRLKRLVPRVGCSERSGHMETGRRCRWLSTPPSIFSRSLSLSHSLLSSTSCSLHYFLFCCCCRCYCALHSYILSTHIHGCLMYWACVSRLTRVRPIVNKANTGNFDQ